MYEVVSGAQPPLYGGQSTMHTRYNGRHLGSEHQPFGRTRPLTLELSSRWPARPPAKNSRVFLVPYRGSRAMLCSSSGMLLLQQQVGKGRPATCIALQQQGSLGDADAAAGVAPLQTPTSAAEGQAAHQDGLAVLEGDDLLGVQTVYLQEATFSKPPVRLQQALSVSQVYVLWWRKIQHVGPCRGRYS